MTRAKAIKAITMTKITAPFTPDQVRHLEDYQNNMFWHPFTCANRGDGNHRRNNIDLGDLVPTVRGWVCRYCNYTQDWAHEFMCRPIVVDDKA